VVVTRRTRAFYHYTVGGELSVEAEEVLSDVVEDVSCRWCDHGRAVEEVDANDLSDADRQATDRQAADDR
jgi:hypothetical protein